MDRARAVAAGYVTTTDEAFERWLTRGRPAFVPREGRVARRGLRRRSTTPAGSRRSRIPVCCGATTGSPALPRPGSTRSRRITPTTTQRPPRATVELARAARAAPCPAAPTITAIRRTARAQPGSVSLPRGHALQIRLLGRSLARATLRATASGAEHFLVEQHLEAVERASQLAGLEQVIRRRRADAERALCDRERLVDDHAARRARRAQIDAKQIALQVAGDDDEIESRRAAADTASGRRTSRRMRSPRRAAAAGASRTASSSRRRRTSRSRARQHQRVAAAAHRDVERAPRRADRLARDRARPIRRRTAKVTSMIGHVLMAQALLTAVVLGLLGLVAAAVLRPARHRHLAPHLLRHLLDDGHAARALDDDVLSHRQGQGRQGRDGRAQRHRRSTTAASQRRASRCSRSARSRWR